MSRTLENPTAAAVSKTAGAEHILALLTLTRAIESTLSHPIGELSSRDLEQLHDVCCKVVQLSAHMLSDRRLQRFLPL